MAITFPAYNHIVTSTEGRHQPAVVLMLRLPTMGSELYIMCAFVPSSSAPMPIGMHDKAGRRQPGCPRCSIALHAAADNSLVVLVPNRPLGHKDVPTDWCLADTGLVVVRRKFNRQRSGHFRVKPHSLEV